MSAMSNKNHCNLNALKIKKMQPSMFTNIKQMKHYISLHFDLPSAELE